MGQSASYGRILKSSSVMGSSAAIVMVLALVRTKFAAEILGVSGVGLIVGFTAIQGLATTIAGMGIGSSSVREIADLSSQDDKALAIIAKTVRRVSLVLGVAGFATICLASPLISNLSFGSVNYAFDVSLVGLAVLLMNLTTAEYALLQGLRRIASLAKASIIGNIAGVFLAVVAYLSLGELGVVPAMIAVAAAQYISARFFAAKLGIANLKVTWGTSVIASKGMFALGFSFMWSALLVTGVSYLTVALVTRLNGIDSAAYFGAAFAVSGAFVGFLLNAMGADFFPRLTQQARNPSALRKLVNEQIEVGSLLVTPGILGSIFFAPLILTILYSKEFVSAAELMQWFLLGALGKVLTWPLSYLVLAMGKAKIYIFSESLINVIHVALILTGLIVFGLIGIGFAYFALYLIYLLLMFFIARKIVHFRFTKSSLLLISYSLGASILAVILSSRLDSTPRIIVGIVATVIAGIYTIRALMSRLEASSGLMRKISTLPGLKLFVPPHKSKEIE